MIAEVEDKRVNYTDGVSVMFGDVKLIDVDKLITENMGIVWYAVKKCKVCSRLFDDAIAEGNLALVKAAKSYSADKDVKFVTYAYKCIIGRIKWFMSTNSSLLKFSTEVYKKSVEVRMYMRQYSLTSTDEITDSDWVELGVLDRDVRKEIMEYINGVVCIDTKIDDEGTTIGDLFVCDNSDEDRKDCSDIINDVNNYIDYAYSKMSESNRCIAKRIISKIINGDTVNFGELGDEFGIKRQTVYQVMSVLKNDSTLKEIIKSRMQ